jgi:microcystin-dependent protein
MRYNSTNKTVEYNNGGTSANWTALATQTYAVPQGAIIMWSGSFASIPSGWALCNGANGTPNLTNQFILGATVTSDVGVTGGSNTHTLSVSELPSHTHTGSTDAAAPALTFTGTGATISHTATFTGE